MASDMTPGELARQLARLETRVDKLETRADVAFVRKDIWEAGQTTIVQDVVEIKERMQRIFWTLVVAVLGVAGNLLTFFLTRAG